METIIDITLFIVLLGLASLPVILILSFIQLKRMYNDWKKYMDNM